jgi:hypothetical protein
MLESATGFPPLGTNVATATLTKVLRHILPSTGCGFRWGSAEAHPEMNMEC